MTIIFWVLFVISVIGTFAILSTTFSIVRRFRMHSGSYVTHDQSLSVIVPIKGADERTKDVFRALVQSETSGKIEYLITMESENDPAFVVAKLIQEEFPNADIRILLSGPSGDRMGKQHNIAFALQHAKYDIVASMDADVTITKDTLQLGLDELLKGNSHLVFYLPFYHGEGKLGGKILAHYVNYYYDLYMGSIAVTSEPKFIIGALWMLSKDTIGKIGGFEQFTGRVSDDAAIGEAVVKQGLRNYLLPRAIQMPTEDLAFTGGFRHIGKWLTMLRAEGVLIFFAVFIMWHPAMWSLLTVIAGWLIGVPANLMLYGGIVFGASILFRTISVLTLNRSVYHIAGMQFVTVILYEMIFAPYLFVKNFFRRTITWKGKQYRLGKHGAIEEK